jgi:hypothetical protein
MLKHEEFLLTSVALWIKSAEGSDDGLAIEFSRKAIRNVTGNECPEISLGICPKTDKSSHKGVLVSTPRAPTHSEGRLIQ